MADKVFLEEGTPMAAQVLKQFESEFSGAVMVRDILPGAAWAPYGTAARVPVRETQESIPLHEEDGNFFRGALAALVMEAGLVLCVWGIWHAWHLFR
jgi:hypothetical protein